MIHFCRNICVLVVLLACSGCATKSYVSLTSGDMSSNSGEKVAQDLVSTLSRTNYGQGEMVFLHSSKEETKIENEIRDSLRSAGYQVESGDSEQSQNTKADIVVAFRATTYDEGKYGSYCLLINNESTTICREYELLTGKPITLLSLQGVEILPDPAERIRRVKQNLKDELLVDIEPVRPVVPQVAPELSDASLQDTSADGDSSDQETTSVTSFNRELWRVNVVETKGDSDGN